MRRVVVHEILIGGGVALLLVACLTTLTARRDCAGTRRTPWSCGAESTR